MPIPPLARARPRARALALARTLPLPLFLLLLPGCPRGENLPDDPRPPSSAEPTVPAAATSARLDYVPPAPPTPTSALGLGPAPVLRDDPPALSNAGLPPEVVRRIVRQNFGRFRLCYQAAAASDPSLSGSVVVRFVIDASGAVAKAADAGSSLGDPDAVACVVRAVSGLAFPEPATGTVIVTETIYFTPRSPAVP